MKGLFISEGQGRDEALLISRVGVRGGGLELMRSVIYLAVFVASVYALEGWNSSGRVRRHLGADWESLTVPTEDLSKYLERGALVAPAKDYTESWEEAMAIGRVENNGTEVIDVDDGHNDIVRINAGKRDEIIIEESSGDNEIVVEDGKDDFVVVEGDERLGNDVEIDTGRPNELIVEPDRNDEVIVEPGRDDEVIVERDRDDEVIIDASRNDEVIIEPSRDDEIYIEPSYSDEIYIEPSYQDIYIEPSYSEAYVEPSYSTSYTEPSYSTFYTEPASLIAPYNCPSGSCKSSHKHSGHSKKHRSHSCHCHSSPNKTTLLVEPTCKSGYEIITPEPWAVYDSQIIGVIDDGIDNGIEIEVLV